jgi:hypothetical protein
VAPRARQTCALDRVEPPEELLAVVGPSRPCHELRGDREHELAAAWGAAVPVVGLGGFEAEALAGRAGGELAASVVIEQNDEWLVATAT